MAKCSIDIKKDIVDKAGKKMSDLGATVEGNVGFFSNPSKSNNAINSINREFNSLVVKAGEKGSFFIEPSSSLIKEYLDEYYKNEEPFAKSDDSSKALASNIFELIPNITEDKIKSIYTNYVGLMNRNREGKAMSFESFKSLLDKYQVYNYKDTYIFGQYDPKTSTFLTRVNSSPSSKELLAEAIPSLVKKGLDFISFVPKDYADKLVRSGYTVSDSFFDYDFKGENMQKFAAASNPNVFKKVFNKTAQQVTSEEIETYNDGVDLKYQPLSIDANLITRAGKELSSVLETYLKQFGIVVKDIETIKNKLEIDELGFADLLSKIVYVKDKKDLPPVAGEFIAYMMQYNPLVKDIITELSQTTKYKNLDKSQYFKVIGELISKDLQNKLEGNYNKSLVDKIKELINKFFELFKTIPIDKINTNVGIISNNILQQNKKLITSSLYKPGQFGKPTEQVSIKKALKSDVFGASIIYKLAKQGFILTGSIALSEQGTILRPDENPLHDIDWVSPFNRKETEEKFLQSYPEALKVRDIYGDGYVTDSYLIAPEGYSISNYKADNYDGKIIINSYDVVDSKGSVVGTYRLEKQETNNQLQEVVTGVEGKVIDFFSYETFGQTNYDQPFSYKSKEGTIIQLSNWKDIFKAKLNFARYKDIWDYNRFIPNDNITPEESQNEEIERDSYTEEQKGEFFQLEESQGSKASPETISKVKKLLEKMGVSLKDLAEYAKGAMLDSKGINAVADIAKKIIAIAEGKEGVALTEEMVHIATAIIEQKNPNLVTEMISKIDRFVIYKKTFDEYKNNPAYQLPNGKPNVRKIKKEAVDRLIAELIIYNNEGSTEFPELMNETNRSMVRTFFEKILDFFRGMYKSANIDIFKETTELIETGLDSTGIDLSSYDLYYQISDAQKALQQRILQTRDDIKKVEDKQAVDPILLDTEEASNWYESKQTDGTFKRVSKRVTDRVKAWYKQRFPNKSFTKEEKEFNELKRTLGVKGHGFFEEVHGRYFNSDGTRKKNTDPRPVIISSADEDVYMKIEKYYSDLIDKFSKDGKNPLVFSEVLIYDPKEKEAGTIDLLIVEEDGKANIFDWKFMSVAADAKDVAWFKQGAYNIQLGRYKDILRDRYGVKKFGMNRAIPIIMDLKKQNPKDQNSPVVLTGILIGSVNTEEIEDLRLVPVSEKTETTGFENLDELIKLLNATYNQVSKQEVTDENEAEFKRDRLNILKQAIRAAQGTFNIAPLVDVIRIMRIEGQQILDDYNTIYKGRPANSSGEDFENEKLSEMSARLREYNSVADVFGRIDDLIGDLIYTKEMEKSATTEEAEIDVADRKELLKNISDEAREIRLSSEKIRNISGEFADKFIGIKNLVRGLLSPEAVVKGLKSTFRGVSELPMASLEILYKIVTNAKTQASTDALGKVNRLMEIRKKLVARGGDVRKLVQQIYQKDDKSKLVNKLIYKFDKAFYEAVDKNATEGNRNKNWLIDNIDIDKYREESGKLLKDKIAYIKKMYEGDEETIERLISEEQVKWDIDTKKGFTGWNNYLIKRHPLAKWHSEEYKNLLKDPELLELYNFITEMNENAKSSGYISNKVASTFLPFVRKGMAESLAWDFDLSAVMNFGNSLSVKADDVGLGKINELNGELENAIPKYYTYDFTRGEDGTTDSSDVSEDIFKNMILYINHSEKYRYLSAVEDQLELVKTIETFKGYVKTDRYNNVVKDENGKVIVLAEGQSTTEGNAKIFNDFLRALLYEQKYPLSDSDTPLGFGKALNFMKGAVNNVAGKEVFKIDENPSATSLVKSMDALNRAFQLKTLGLEFISGAINAFGTNIQISAQAGNYFKGREVVANEAKLVGNRFKNDEEREMFIQLIDTFMPLKDDPTYDKLKKAGLTKLTQLNFSDMLMVFMREPEQHIEKSIFLTLLDNTMVEDGKIVSILEFVKKKYKDRYSSAAKYNESYTKIDEEVKELKRTRSITATKKLENGKLVIPGLDLSNTTETQRLKNLTRLLSRNATGGLSDADMNRMGMNIWTNSIMVFRRWIPKLVDTRFGEFRKVSDDFSVEIDDDGMTTGEKYDIGRFRLFAYVMGTSIRDRSANIYNILSVNDKGLDALNKMYEDFAEKFEKRTGKPLEMTRDEFIDMIRNNLRNQIKELAILMSMFGSMIALGLIAPDDEDDKASKNFHRYALRTVDKFIGELSFYYNPAEFHKLLSGSMFPAIGIFSDVGRFTNHFFMETTGLDLSNSELTADEVREKAQPIKNFGKMLPITKSLFTYGAILNSEFAEEFDITIQKESRR